MTPDISIGYLLCNSERTKTGSLDDFFRHIAAIEKKSGLITENIVLVSDKTRDRTMEIARNHCKEAEYFHYENDMSKLKNSLLERANGNWVFMPEPDMVYDTGFVAGCFKKAAGLEGYKCVESWQKVVHPDGNIVKNLYYLLIKKDPSVRFHGLVFENLKGVFPHETLIIDSVAGTHYVKKFSARIEGARPLFEEELKQLDAQKTDNPEELYWSAMRYNELGFMECVSREEMDSRVVSLLGRAIKLKPDFGPAYAELAKQHIYMGRTNDARKAAKEGCDNSGYELCKNILKELMPNVVIIDVGR